MKGLVAFSFGLTREPNPCNQQLAEEVKRIRDAERGPVCVVSQWEITKALLRAGMRGVHSVERHRNPGAYLDSDEVMAQAATIFRRRNIREVIVVAQPFLQLWLCRWLVRRAGFISVRRPIGKIGFCPASRNWQDRSPIHLLLYVVLRLLGLARFVRGGGAK